VDHLRPSDCGPHPHRWRHLRQVAKPVALLAVAGVLAAPTATAVAATPTAGPTAAASSTLTPTPSGDVTTTTPDPPAPSGVDEPGPAPGAGPRVSDEQARRDVAQADLLRSRLLSGDARLEAARAQVETLGAQAAAALQQVRTAREQQAAATAQVLAQLRRLSRLQQQVASSQVDLSRWARTSYAAGGALATSWQGWVTALESGSTDDVGHDLAVMQHVGLVGSLALDRLEVTTATQRDAADAAARAATAAATARRAAEAARSTADALVREQRAALVGLQAEQVRTELAVARLRQQLMSEPSAAGLVAEARLAATVRVRAASAGHAAAVPLDPGGCTGLDLSVYANGQIPALALCPVWGAPGQLLEAHAAGAFSALSRAFALQFARPICVTDSYRSRTAQVAVYAAKPGLAAVPGTSNHGWGTALDLCGGVESFTSPEHAWLLVNAPAHDWFHPAWTEPTGSKPEPWHWEFAG